jgi:NADPH:quinone reductase-like Zn-dependent oxidoreductase
VKEEKMNDDNERNVKKMKAVRIHARGGPEQLVYEDAPQPQPAAGEVLVRVYATAVTPTELGWSTTWKTRAGADRHLPIPGHDLSGVIAEIGSGVMSVATGMAVYALTDFHRDGAEAEYTIALPTELAPKPRSLNYIQAAAVPMSALTAWQALFDHAGLSSGQNVLIHGASGGVGTFAVQLAHWAGAHVMGTASARNRDFVRGLGADEFIDYTTTHFEDVVHNVDVVLDTVGGDTLERSWKVLRKGGILVSIVGSPTSEQAAAYSVRAATFIVQPDREQLTRIGELIDAGRIHPVIEAVMPLSQARQAYERGQGGHASGKVVLQVAG